MPGTPEPDRFANDASGHVALVEIAGPSQLPCVKQHPVATLTWRSLTFDFLSAESSRSSLSAIFAELTPTANRTVLRITLTGTASPPILAEVRAWLEQALIPFLVGQIQDQTRVALSPVELADLKVRHPILAQVLVDIDRLETLAGGTLVVSAPSTTGELPPASVPLTLAEVQEILAPSKIDLARLMPELFVQLRQSLLQTLQEVAQ